MKVDVEKYIDIILKNSLVSFSVFLIFLASLYPGISNFQLDASSDSLVLENDPDLRTYREMGNLFSDSDFLIITLRPNEGIFNNKSLQRIEKIENEILEIDGVNQVLSILDAPIVEQPKVSLSEARDRATTDRAKPIVCWMDLSVLITTNLIIIGLSEDWIKTCNQF